VELVANGLKTMKTILSNDPFMQRVVDEYPDIINRVGDLVTQNSSNKIIGIEAA